MKKYREPNHNPVSTNRQYIYVHSFGLGDIWRLGIHPTQVWGTSWWFRINLVLFRTFIVVGSSNHLKLTSYLSLYPLKSSWFSTPIKTSSPSLLSESSNSLSSSLYNGFNPWDNPFDFWVSSGFQTGFAPSLKKRRNYI